MHNLVYSHHNPDSTQSDKKYSDRPLRRDTDNSKSSSTAAFGRCKAGSSHIDKKLQHIVHNFDKNDDERNLELAYVTPNMASKGDQREYVMNSKEEFPGIDSLSVIKEVNTTLKVSDLGTYEKGNSKRKRITHDDHSDTISDTNRLARFLLTKKC